MLVGKSAYLIFFGTISAAAALAITLPLARIFSKCLDRRPPQRQPPKEVAAVPKQRLPGQWLSSAVSKMKSQRILAAWATYPYSISARAEVYGGALRACTACYTHSLPPLGPLIDVKHFCVEPPHRLTSSVIRHP